MCFSYLKQTQALMQERDEARNKLKHSKMERKSLLLKYKKLRNQTTTQIRADTKNANGKRIEESKNEGEMWKIVNDIMKPNSEQTWKLKEGDTVIDSELEIANTFNKFFIEKVINLK